MPTYDLPSEETLNYAAVNFGSGTTTRVFRTPKGRRARIQSAVVEVTTSFVGSTSPGKLQLGDGTTANKYIDLSVGATGAGTAAAHSVRANDYASGLVANNNASLPWLYLEADTEYTVTFVAPVGSPAGIADVAIRLAYF